MRFANAEFKFLIQPLETTTLVSAVQFANRYSLTESTFDGKENVVRNMQEIYTSMVGSLKYMSLELLQGRRE